ncbi:hypothetical protein B0J11DRAFT_87518 [Dendryphion nanum]|uniref:Uncharacterized protein n=1 Tax=Dendryphion nanum TaxID=256645 RepID=A0A9P9DHM5_9PLEO|nr:hypothetical protein B0J11DRAFT_87518 [Dendryphion nanum]
MESQAFNLPSLTWSSLPSLPRPAHANCPAPQSTRGHIQTSSFTTHQCPFFLFPQGSRLKAQGSRLKTQDSRESSCLPVCLPAHALAYVGTSTCTDRRRPQCVLLGITYNTLSLLEIPKSPPQFILLTGSPHTHGMASARRGIPTLLLQGLG